MIYSNTFAITQDMCTSAYVCKCVCVRVCVRACVCTHTLFIYIYIFIQAYQKGGDAAKKSGAAQISSNFTKTGLSGDAAKNGRKSNAAQHVKIEPPDVYAINK